MASRKLRYLFVLVCSAAALAKNPEPELPPCPTNYQLLPNNLPMHCKMVNPPSYAAAPPAPFPPQFPPYFPGPIVGKQVETNPAAPKPVPPPAAPAPAFPPAPIGMPAMPMGMGAPMPMGMPGMPVGMPGMPMVGGPPSPKLPVIVMPFYSPDPSYKNSKGQPSHRRPKPYKRRIRVIKRSRHRHYDTDSSTDTDTDSSDTDTTDHSSDSDRGFWNWKNRRSMSRRKKIKHIKNRESYLTPILQYVSKDGYVIFEKQISKHEAKDWLGDVKDPQEVVQKEEEKKPSQAVAKHEKTEEDDDPEPVERVKPTNKFKPVNSEQKVFVKYSKNSQRSYKNPNQSNQQGPKNKRQH